MAILNKSNNEFAQHCLVHLRYCSKRLFSIFSKCPSFLRTRSRNSCLLMKPSLSLSTMVTKLVSRSLQIPCIISNLIVSWRLRVSSQERREALTKGQLSDRIK